MSFYSDQVLTIRERHLPKPAITRHLVRAKNFIDDHYCDDIDLSAISAFSFLSKFHFIRLFKRCYGITPHQYLVEKRLILAKKLLVSGATVIDACNHIGFDSPNTFSATFKKYTGVRPSDYREKQFLIGRCQKSIPILPPIKH